MHSNRLYLQSETRSNFGNQLTIQSRSLLNVRYVKGPWKEKAERILTSSLVSVGLLQQTTTDWVVKSNRNVFFTVPALGGSNAGCQQGQCLGSGCLPACTLYPHPPAPGRGELTRGPFRGAHPVHEDSALYDLLTSQRPHL